MKKLFLSLLLICLVTCTLVSFVSAQPLPYFTVKFDTLYYYLGQTGAVQVNIETPDQAFDIRDMGLQFYFARTDGTRFVSELFLVNYTDTPLQLSENDNANVTIEFSIPTRSDLITGIFKYVFYVNLREQGTTTYFEESSGEQFAKIDDDYCVLISSETTPSPTPTTSPTPTSTPTATPTSTPTPTATPTSTPNPTATPPPTDFSLLTVFFVLGIVIIAVLLVIILILLRKGKE